MIGPASFPQSPTFQPPTATQQAPAQIAQQPQAPAAESLPSEALTALYKDTMSSYVDFKMKEAAYQGLAGSAAPSPEQGNPFAGAPGSSAPANPQPSFLPGQPAPEQLPQATPPQG